MTSLLNYRHLFPAFLIPWLLIALISTTALYFQRGQSIAWLDILPVKLAVWLFWGLYGLLIFRLARRFGWKPGQWWKTIGFHIPFSLLTVVIQVLFYSWIVFLLDLGGMRDLSLSTIFTTLLPGLLEWYLIIYWAIVIFTFAFDYYKKYRNKELQALQLEKRLIQSQLQTLKMQLHPHFLFNTLNTIVAQVRLEQKQTAIKMLSGLAELLRISLNQRNTQIVPLEEEIRFTEKYLELEKERFGGRLEVDIQFDPEMANFPVPALLLQPLVENAIYHGLAKKLEARKLEISGLKAGEHLRLTIRNDGPALPEDFNLSYYTGIGLTNTIERLSQLYGPDHDFSIRNVDSGVQVVILLPLVASSQ